MSGATQATVVLDRNHVDYTLHSYHHDARAESFGAEAASQLGVDPARLFKTLIVTVDGGLVCGIVPVAGSLDLKAVAAAVGGKKAAMAAPAAAQRATGYVIGGISPLGHRNRIPIVLDSTALLHDTVLVSAGKRGLQVELAGSDLARLTAAVIADISAA